MFVAFARTPTQVSWLFQQLIRTFFDTKEENNCEFFSVFVCTLRFVVLDIVLFTSLDESRNGLLYDCVDLAAEHHVGRIGGLEVFETGEGVVDVVVKVCRHGLVVRRHGGRELFHQLESTLERMHDERDRIVPVIRVEEASTDTRQNTVWLHAEMTTVPRVDLFAFVDLCQKLEATDHFRCVVHFYCFLQIVILIPNYSMRIVHEVQRLRPGLSYSLS
jgi:hypothetical protein